MEMALQFYPNQSVMTMAANVFAVPLSSIKAQLLKDHIIKAQMSLGAYAQGQGVCLNNMRCKTEVNKKIIFLQFGMHEIFVRSFTYSKEC